MVMITDYLRSSKETEENVLNAIPDLFCGAPQEGVVVLSDGAHLKVDRGPLVVVPADLAGLSLHLDDVVDLRRRVGEGAVGAAVLVRAHLVHFHSPLCLPHRRLSLSPTELEK